MHEFISFILYTSIVLNAQGYKINITGSKYYEYSYQEIINQDNFINNFVVYTKDYKYYFYPSIDYKKIGTFTYTLNVFNENGYGGFNFELNIIDNTPPLIYGIDKIYYSSKKDINVNNILSFFYGEDEIDGRLNVYVYDYLESSKKNILTLRCSDKSNNYADKKVEIIYQENLNLLFIKKDLKINIYKDKFYSANDLIDIMIKNKLIENISDFKAEFKNKQHLKKYDTIGIFQEEISLIYKGKEYNLKLNLYIEDSIKNDTLLNKIIKFIRKLILRVGEFFYEE